MYLFAYLCCNLKDTKETKSSPIRIILKSIFILSYKSLWKTIQKTTFEIKVNVKRRKK